MKYTGLNAYTLFSLAAASVPIQELVQDVTSSSPPPSPQPRKYVATTEPTAQQALRQEIAEHNRKVEEARRQKKALKAVRALNADRKGKS